MAKHLVYLAIGFPPASKSSTYRLRAHANAFAESGFEITVINACDAAWEQEMGIDSSLLNSVDPSIRIVKLPLFRPEFETDIRKMSAGQVFNYKRWLKNLRETEIKVFPEPAFGSWLHIIVDEIREIHKTRPIDRLAISVAPYVLLGVVNKIFDDFKISYVIDYRDAWQFDVLTGAPKYEEGQIQYSIERLALANAQLVSFVNENIRNRYAETYPDHADKFVVSRNGFDANEIESIESVRALDNQSFTVGYLGTLNISNAHLSSILFGWRRARQLDVRLDKAELHIAGYLGSGPNRNLNARNNLLAEFFSDGVRVLGPIARNQLVTTYSKWDSLLFPATGGRFVTSGKVYELMATGLPIISSHDDDLEATSILAKYPNWVGNGNQDIDLITQLFINAFNYVQSSDAKLKRDQSRTFAKVFDRKVLADEFASAILATGTH